MNILITGGTVFVSRFCAEYFVAKGHDVFVLNRNSSVQSSGVTLLNCDRHDFTALQNTLSGINFDVVIDVTAYTADDVEKLCLAINKRPSCYILISSSAVYLENALQPFGENTTVGVNKIWGDYGTNKIAAENKLLDYYPNAYILRPPYLYGQMNNLYREAFVFECAERNLPFYLPRNAYYLCIAWKHTPTVSGPQWPPIVGLTTCISVFKSLPYFCFNFSSISKAKSYASACPITTL